MADLRRKWSTIPRAGEELTAFLEREPVIRFVVSLFL